MNVVVIPTLLVQIYSFVLAASVEAVTREYEFVQQFFQIPTAYVSNGVCNEAALMLTGNGFE
jgi:hypothetical protein